MTPPRPTDVRHLGPATRRSPLCERVRCFVGDQDRVLLDANPAELAREVAAGREPLSFEIAGPRETLYFDPGHVTAGIVTCGGLCPGLNNVVRGLVLALWHHYGCRDILGFRYGYEGLSSQRAADPIRLTPELVEPIHEHGGTMLGTSRGPQDLDDMVATLDRFGVDLLFTVGGDGTLRGALALCERLRNHPRPVAVVGIPKTIDNDIQWVTRSFGFTTAVAHSDLVLTAAHAEARAARNGVGLVKLMGRHSGFIAAHATLASADVNFCLIPEVDVPMDGEGGFLQALETRLDERRHALVVVAEGFGQHELAGPGGVAHDASGNPKLQDCGVWLRDRIRAYFQARRKHVDVKYIDPSYVIRSVPAGSRDAEFCLALAYHAAHAAMSGRTATMIGHWHERYTHVPMEMAVAGRRQLRTDDPLWQRVLETTGQRLESRPAAP
ncbi:MAG: ATP-dependent 6-phosphofructokinase [Planctomycetes bacterium]|nr:ATP-dependent 6-phosphofructokinase [Planctomycetota bacterium]